MISYRDMTFCLSNCTNKKCERHFGSEDRLKAESWWGGEDAPVAFADFSPTCEDYEYAVPDDKAL